MATRIHVGGWLAITILVSHRRQAGLEIEWPRREDVDRHGCGSSDAKAPAKKTDRLAQKWADMMTEQFEALAKAQPIFAEVRGCMDLSVVAT